MRSIIAGTVLVVLLSACSSTPERAPEQPPAEEQQQPQEPVLDPAAEAYESISLAMSVGDPEKKKYK